MSGQTLRMHVLATESQTGLVIRRWRLDDAAALSRSVEESSTHLRPWMPWIAAEPLSPAQRRDLLARWDADWEGGGDRLFGIFIGERVAGACGLHRRLDARGLEIGYWVHVDHVGRGIATAAAARMADEAFREHGIERVEIHHDVANVASAAVARKLGFELVGQRSVVAAAPAETGSHRIWVMTRSRWLR